VIKVLFWSNFIILQDIGRHGICDCHLDTPTKRHVPTWYTYL